MTYVLLIVLSTLSSLLKLVGGVYYLPAAQQELSLIRKWVKRKTSVCEHIKLTQVHQPDLTSTSAILFLRETLCQHRQHEDVLKIGEDFVVAKYILLQYNVGDPSVIGWS